MSLREILPSPNRLGAAPKLTRPSKTAPAWHLGPSVGPLDIGSELNRLENFVIGGGASPPCSEAPKITLAQSSIDTYTKLNSIHSIIFE
jgi:hypothetical protein